LRYDYWPSYVPRGSEKNGVLQFSNYAIQNVLRFKNTFRITNPEYMFMNVFWIMLFEIYF